MSTCMHVYLDVNLCPSLPSPSTAAAGHASRSARILCDCAPRSPPLKLPQLGALGLGTVLFQFAVGFFAPLIIATTPRVAAAHAESGHLVRALVRGRDVAQLSR